MTSYRLTEPVAEDLAEIMAWSEHTFGPLHAARYRRLLVDPMDDVAVDPALLGASRVARFRDA
jgi:plasmid stabilization system protein ParE